MPGRLLLPKLLLVLALAVPAPATAQEPPFVDWSSLLPGLTTAFQPDSDNDCASGRVRCIDAAIREMQRRFGPLAAACDHDAIFALAYLRTTQQYRLAVANPSFFVDTPFVN